MEASERPQLAFGETADGIVRALDDRLVIESLTVEDERASRLVRDRAQSGRPAADTVRKAIEIGSRVLDSEATAANVDYVKRELESGLGQLDEELRGTLKVGAEALAQQLGTAFGAERNDSVQAQIREIVATGTREQMQALAKLLTAEDTSNPLVAVQARLGKAMLEAEERHRAEVERLREAHTKDARAMHGQVAEMRKEVARLLDKGEHEIELAEAEAAGTRKGFSFEERVDDAIGRIAATRGDAASHTGGEVAEGGGKKGDTLVEIGACDGPCRGRIVFEAKDKRLSKNDAWKELNAAMGARAAAFAVLVVADEEKVPAGREQLTEYEGNKMIVAVDREEPAGLALEVAYRLAAARVAMAHDRELTVDGAEVRAAAEEALSALRQAQSVRSALTGIKTQSDRARDGLNSMVEAVQVKLERIDLLVAEVADVTESDEPRLDY